MLDPALAELAGAHGVATGFGDWRGGGAQASAAAIVAVLAALGVDASTPAAIERALADVRDAPWRRMVPRYVVARGGRVAEVAVHVPHGDPVSVWVELDEGGRRELRQLMIWVDPREIDGGLVGEATFEIPDDVPLGYHQLHVVSGERHARCQLMVVPDRIDVPAGRAWGFMLQLYAVRSKRSWSIGDLRDLRELATWSAGELGAGFVLVNPLHAAEPVPPMEPSPYFPASRRFINPLYLRVEDVPEVSSLPSAAVENAARTLQAKNAGDDDLDRDVVWAAKRRILAAAFAAAFVTDGDVERHAAFTEFVDREGESLVDFATWCALADRHGLPWREWPAELRDSRSPAVADFRAAERELVDFHCWLQWLCAQQLNDVQQSARAAGMSIGLLLDLAVGVSPGGADAWALRRLLADGVTLGAPADMYNQQGQRWNLPTWRPDALAEVGFRPYRDLVRASLGRGGGLRIDHVIGLFRQWWVPEGATPADATYVRLDHEAMVGILLLEAQRAGAVVVGEDLGNVEPWVRDYLRERGVLGTSILWFERDDAGRPRPPDQWRELCLATVTTHDLPPTAGYLAGAHVEIRAGLGLLERGVEDERVADEADRLDWIRALGAQGLLDPEIVAAVTTASTQTGTPGRAGFAERTEPYLDQIVEALHAYLCATPARLLGVYLPDVVGDRRPVNQPGTLDEYPNWRVPMTDAQRHPVLLDDLMDPATHPDGRRLALLVAAAAASVTVASVADPQP
jgi:4-alpha-glucanotransferase